jgi:hypothetical protein
MQIKVNKQIKEKISLLNTLDYEEEKIILQIDLNVNIILYL